MAELLETDCQGERQDRNRQQPGNETNRGYVRSLRCASRSRVRRRTGTNRPALLYELGGAQVRERREPLNSFSGASSSFYLAPLNRIALNRNLKVPQVCARC